jgi:multidrug efflux pump subunit AcrA (membrane-fusion protein)
VTSILKYSKVWVAGLAVVSLAACQSSTPEPAGEALTPVDLKIGLVTTAEWPSTHEAGGVVRARQTAVVSAQVVAPVLEVRVKAGDRVRSGQTLVVLDGRQLGAYAAQATAAAAGSRLGLEAAQAEQRSAESALVLAKLTYDRVRGLNQKDSATAQELDQATAGLAAADARAAAAKARVAEASAGINAATAAEQAASVGVSYTTLAAPFDGIVSARHADPGSLASPGTPLVTVEDTGGYRIEAQMDESRAQLVTPGGPADVRLDRPAGETGTDWQRSKVAEIANIDPARHSFTVKVDLPDSGGLRSGLFGRVRILGPSRKVLVAPRSAIVKRGQLTFAFVVDAEGAARLRMVSVGEESGGQIEVLAGLHEGDQVVIGPPASLEDGRPVRGAARAPAGGEAK